MAVSIVMPKLGMVMAEGVLAKWAKSPGDPVAQGEVVAEIETEKIEYELEATGSGTFHPVVSEGAIVPVDGVLGYLLAEGEAPPGSPAATKPASEKAPAAAATKPSARRAPGEVVPSTPGARRLALKLGVDVSQVTPSGPRGRVVEADVRTFADGQKATPEPPVAAGTLTPSRSVPIRGIRKAIAEHMRGSIANTAQLSFVLEVDVTEATRLRREASKNSDATVTTADVLINACAYVLTRHPELNTTLRDGTILYFDEVNIGLAVALSDGLIVPVVKNAHEKDIFQIARETDELSSKARDGKLLPEEVSGGTFTISVLGTVDGFTPILNQGQSSLLGAGRSVQKPVVRNGEIVIREIITLSLTVDHQVIDGAVAASFLRRLQQTIERPAALFKEG